VPSATVAGTVLRAAPDKAGQLSQRSVFQVMKFEHLILTRFNVRLPLLNQPPPDAAWLRHRFSLFERFCLPSVVLQREQRFRWLVFFDVGTPKQFLHHIEGYRNRLPFFYPVFVASFDLPVIREMVEEVVDETNDYVLSSRLDNDDAIARDYTLMVQEVARGEKESRVFISFRHGYVHCGGGIYLREYLANPFFSVLEPRTEISTGYLYNHHEIAGQGLVREICNYRGWMQVVHGNNLANRLPRWPRRVRKSSLKSAFPPTCIDGPDSIIRWSSNNLIHYARRYGGPIKRAVKRPFLSLCARSR
jgi:putative rhamnosyltransferase